MLNLGASVRSRHPLKIKGHSLMRAFHDTLWGLELQIGYLWTTDQMSNTFYKLACNTNLRNNL